MGLLEDLMHAVRRLQELVGFLDEDIKAAARENQLEEERIARMERNVSEVRAEVIALDERIAILARGAIDDAE